MSLQGRFSLRTQQETAGGLRGRREVGEYTFSVVIYLAISEQL